MTSELPEGLARAAVRRDGLVALVPAPGGLVSLQVHAADPAVDAVERDVIGGAGEHVAAGGGEAKGPVPAVVEQRHGRAREASATKRSSGDALAAIASSPLGAGARRAAHARVAWSSAAVV